MSAELQVVIGSMMLAAGLSYAWWVHFRVWMLRQDLFAIRDELWDAMKARGALDEAAHREVRDALNAFIRVAPLLSVFTFLRILFEGAHHPEQGEMAAPMPEIEEARRRTASRVMNYLFFETLMGLAVVACVSILGSFILIPSQLVRSAIFRMVERVMDSTELVAMGTFVARPANAVATRI